MQTTRGGALFTEVGFDFLAGNGAQPAAFRVVIAAVDHFAGLRKLIEVSLYDILHQLVRGSASALQGDVLELLFRLGGEMHFHRSRLLLSGYINGGKTARVKTRQPELSDFSRRKPTAKKSAIAGRRKADP